LTILGSGKNEGAMDTKPITVRVNEEDEAAPLVSLRVRVIVNVPGVVGAEKVNEDVPVAVI
jgi:hypothetical protein